MDRGTPSELEQRARPPARVRWLSRGLERSSWPVYLLGLVLGIAVSAAVLVLALAAG